jgi:mannose-6-phosphate isomerase-like protein (cupin superfamily)
MASDATLDAENAAMIRDEARAGGFVITRASQAEPMRPKKPRGVADPSAMLHPATLRGLQQLREDTGPPGASAMVLFSSETLHVSYAWFKSGYPLPLHSHDADCYYLIVGGSMKVGTEVLEKGDGVLIPAGAPYTVTPLDEGVEFIEFRNSEDYDTNFRSKSETYWDRIAETRKARGSIWAEEAQPVGFIPVPGAKARNP